MPGFTIYTCSFIKVFLDILLYLIIDLPSQFRVQSSRMVINKDDIVSFLGLQTSIQFFKSCSNGEHCKEPSPLAAQQFNKDDIRTKHSLVDFETVGLLIFNLGKGGNFLLVCNFLYAILLRNVPCVKFI